MGARRDKGGEGVARRRVRRRVRKINGKNSNNNKEEGRGGGLWVVFELAV